MFSLNEIKAIIQPGERFIIVEDGEPKFVVLSFQDYLILSQTSAFRVGAYSSSGRAEAPIEHANAEFSDASAFPADPSGVQRIPDEGFEPDPGSVRLEDLPL